MNPADYIVLVCYVIGVFIVGGIFGARIKSSGDMFAAGNQSPWWLAGLSGFMTMFSAGTFVVWGSIAYQHGLVAIVINLTYGVAALSVGWFVAGRWRSLGLTTAAEFLELRFGKPALLFYTLVNMTYKLVTVSVALYSVGVLLSPLVPVDAGSSFADPETGTLSLSVAIVGLGAIVAVYTVVGGLWAVLMTDVLQFIVLMAAVAFVVPMMLMKVGGVSAFIQAAPEGFFSPTTADWTWWIVAGWCATQFFMIGAEWAFVQRYLCVPTAKDAKKAAWLFGIMYLVSPMLWMLPPMIYRTMDSGANPEQAYILACEAVLPAGMTGLMLAAMFSATASMVDSQLNVFAGVLTNDFYRPFVNPRASEGHLVSIGRIVTALLGVVLIGLALLVPHLGGATDVVVTVTSLVVGPLLLPTLWGLYSKHVSQSCVWVTAALSFTIGLLIKYGLVPGVTASRASDMVVGVLVPLITLAVLEVLGRGKTATGWKCVTQQIYSQEAQPIIQSSSLPGKIVAWNVVACGLFIGGLAIFDHEDWVVLTAFGGLMCLIGIVVGLVTRQSAKAETADERSKVSYA